MDKLIKLTLFLLSLSTIVMHLFLVCMMKKRLCFLECFSLKRSVMLRPHFCLE